MEYETGVIDGNEALAEELAMMNAKKALNLQHDSPVVRPEKSAPAAQLVPARSDDAAAAGVAGASSGAFRAIELMERVSPAISSSTTPPSVRSRTPPAPPPLPPHLAGVGPKKMAKSAGGASKAGAGGVVEDDATPRSLAEPADDDIVQGSLSVVNLNAKEQAVQPPAPMIPSFGTTSLVREEDSSRGTSKGTSVGTASAPMREFR